MLFTGPRSPSGYVSNLEDVSSRRGYSDGLSRLRRTTLVACKDGTVEDSEAGK